MKKKKLKKLLATAVETIDDLEKDNRELDLRIDNYIAQLESMKSDSLKGNLFDQTNKAAGILMERNKELMKANQELANKLVDAENKFMLSQQRLADTGDDLLELTKRYESVKHEAEVLWKKREEESKEIAHLRSQRNDLQKHNTDLIFENRNLKASGAIPYLDPVDSQAIPEREVIQWNFQNFGSSHFPKEAVDIIVKLSRQIQENQMIPVVDLDTMQKVVFELEKSVGYRLLLGCMEELGEIAHVHLKREQGIRIGTDPIASHEAIKDGIGDLLIYLINYADSQAMSLKDCFDHAWEQVKNRDWQKNKMDGWTEENAGAALKEKVIYSGGAPVDIIKDHPIDNFVREDPEFKEYEDQDAADLGAEFIKDNDPGDEK